MGFDDTRHMVVMKCSALIKGSCIPKNNKTSYPSTISGKKNEMSIVGFINGGLQEQKGYNVYADFIHDWSTHVSPQTMGDHIDTITFPVLLS